jgi:hypothetical protein
VLAAAVPVHVATQIVVGKGETPELLRLPLKLKVPEVGSVCVPAVNVVAETEMFQPAVPGSLTVNCSSAA